MHNSFPKWKTYGKFFLPCKKVISLCQDIGSLGIDLYK